MRNNSRRAYRLVWVLFSSLLFSISAPTQIGAVSTVTITGTVGYYDSATSTVVPMVGKLIEVGSGANGVGISLRTDSLGRYSFTVPSGTDYSFNLTSISQITDPLPAHIMLYLSQLDFSVNRVLNVTFPPAKKLRVKITDQNGNPLPGAILSLGGGTNYGTDTRADISPYTAHSSQNINFSTGYGGVALRYPADSQGYATLYTFNFTTPINAYLEYTVPAGFKVYGNFTYTPDRDQELTKTLAIPDTVRVSGTFSWTDSASVVRPIPNLVVTFGGGGTSVDATTNSSGQYSALVPADSDYTATAEWITGGIGKGRSGNTHFPSTSIEMAPNITIYLRNLTFETNTALNVTLPRSRKIEVTVEDESHTAIQNAKVYTPAGTFTGTYETPTVTGYGGPITSQISFSTGYNDDNKIYRTNAQGKANLWFFKRDYPLDALVMYDAPAGFRLTKAFSFTPSDDTSTVVTLSMPAPKVISGRISYTDTNSALVPVANKTISFGSGATGSSVSTTTDSNGDYSVSVIPANDYSFSLEWMPSLTAPLPAYVSVGFGGIKVLSDTTFNITLPRAHKISTTITDAANQPMKGAKTSLGTSTYYGTNSQVLVSGYTEPLSSLTRYFMFGTSSGGFTPMYPANSSGVATMYAFSFPNQITGLVEYKTTSGFSISKPLQLTPTADLNLSSQFSNIVVASSLGNNIGDLNIFSSYGTTISNVSIAPSTSNYLPDGVIDLTGILTYRVNGLTFGQTVTMTFVLPNGVSPTNIFKVINGSLVDLSSIATFESQTVTMIIQDGGDGDDDGTVNGVIVDPLIFVNTASSTAVATLSSFAINGTSVITPGSTITVANGTTSVNVVANPTASGASRIITGNTGLVTGANTVTVRVTATNGIKMETYTATVNVAAPTPAPSAPAPSVGGGGGGGVGTTWFNLFVSNPDDSTQAYQGEACAIFVHKLKEGDKNLGPVCATKAGSLDFEANDGDFVIKTYDKTHPTFYKEYKAKVTFGTFEVVGAGYRGGSVPRRVITVLKPSEYPVVPVATPTPTATPTPSVSPIPSPTPTVTATPSPSPKPTSPVSTGIKNGYLATTNSTIGAIKVAINSARAKVNQSLTKPLSVTLPASTSTSEVLMTIKMPDGKVATILKGMSVKNKATTSPALKFAKAGVYVLSVKVGSQSKTLTITVK
jgi:hypothetical protein